MREPRSYIVRIYRQGYRSLAGTVEDADTGVRRPFKTVEELVGLLRTPVAKHAAHRSRTKVADLDIT